MDKLVENAPDDFNARLARGRWYWQIATQELSLLSEDRNQMLQVAREEAMAASSIDPESPKRFAVRRHLGRTRQFRQLRAHGPTVH